MLSNKKLYWTEHAKIKMRQYGLSKIKLIQLLYRPEREEVGIVPGTMAVMKTNPIRNNVRYKRPISNGASKVYKKALGEVWLMYKDVKGLRKIISAWRYPGISKTGEAADIIAKYSD